MATVAPFLSVCFLLGVDADICLWLNMHCEGFRVAPYGSKTGIESEAQQAQRRSDEEFDAALLEKCVWF